MTIEIVNLTRTASHGKVHKHEHAGTASAGNHAAFDAALARQRSARAGNDDVPRTDHVGRKRAHGRDQSGDDHRHAPASGTAPAAPATADNKQPDATGHTRNARKIQATGGSAAEAGAEPGVRPASAGAGAAHPTPVVTAVAGKQVETVTTGAPSATAATAGKHAAAEAALQAVTGQPATGQAATATGKQGTGAVFIAGQAHGPAAAGQGAAAIEGGKTPHGARAPLHAGTQATGHVATAAVQAGRAVPADAALAAGAGGQETAPMTRQALITPNAPAPGAWGAPTAADLPGFSTTSLTPLAQSTLAASSPLPTSQPAFTMQLAASFGSEGWNRALQQQSLRLTRMGGGRAELTLHPRELGQIQVSLKLGDQTHLHFVSPNAQVRAAVEAALPQLRHAFAQSGINLGQASVGDQGQQQYGSERQLQRHQGRTAIAGPAEVTESTAVTITHIGGRTAAGGVDIFA